MIGRLSGTLIQKQPPWLMIDVQGVGYEVEAPLSVFFDLPELGQKLTLLTHLSIKEDSHSLYGFLHESDRQLFRSLLKISGVGAKLALTILSGVSADEFVRLVEDGDTVALTRLPGIGKKTAQRLVMEMKDRIGDLGLGSGEIRLPTGTGAPRSAGIAPGATGEATAALEALGYKPAEASRMIRAVAQPDMNAETLIREALQSVVKR